MCHCHGRATFTVQCSLLYKLTEIRGRGTAFVFDPHVDNEVYLLGVRTVK